MNKETIKVSAEVKTFLHDLYSQIEYELQEQYKDEVQKLNGRINKAIEYIENPRHEMSVKTYQNLLEILKGGNNE